MKPFVSYGKPFSFSHDKPFLAHLKLFFFLSITCALLLMFDTLSLLSWPKGLLQTVTIPIQYGFYQTGGAATNQFTFFFMARRSAQENKALKGQLGELLSENSILRRRLAETEAMVDQANFISPKTFNLLPARPIGLGRYLLIDKGSADGVKINQAVVLKDNYIGLVKTVDAKVSQVQLLSDPDSKIAVFAQGPAGKARGILQGQFGSEALMDKILHAEKVEEGSLVYAEGTEGMLPRGLVMGRVGEVMERENEVFKRAKVQPVFDIRDLELVFVIKE